MGAEFELNAHRFRIVFNYFHMFSHVFELKVADFVAYASLFGSSSMIREGL